MKVVHYVRVNKKMILDVHMDNHIESAWRQHTVYYGLEAQHHDTNGWCCELYFNIHYHHIQLQTLCDAAFVII